MNVWLPPGGTLTAPLGVIVPPVPGVDVIVYDNPDSKVATMLWFAITFVNVYELTAPTEDPSTVTSLMR